MPNVGPTLFEATVTDHEGKLIYIHCDADGFIWIESGLDYTPIVIKPAQAQALADAILAALKSTER
jgi:hypothetical protein